MSKVKTEVTDDEDRNITEFDEMEVSELRLKTDVTASLKSEIQGEVADDDDLKVTEFDKMEVSELQTEVTYYALVKSEVQSEVTDVDDSIVTEFDEIEISEHQFKTEVLDDDDLKVTKSDEMEVGEDQLKIEVTDCALVKCEVQREVTDVDHSKVTEFDEIEISEQQIKTEITNDNSEETEIRVEECQLENKVTNDDDGETEVDESEIRELLEQKLNNIAIGSIRARKSGPGSAWSSENNTYCGVLNCTSTTDSCRDLWFFKLPLHRHEPERRAKWLRKIGRPDIETCHRVLVCGRHFDSKDMTGSKSKIYLKKGVIPTLHLPAAHKIQNNLRQANPKHVYKRTYKKVNETIDNDGQSSSGTQNVYRSKRPKIQIGDLETTITEKEVEASPTKNIETKQEEKKELLLLSTLCNELDSRQLKTFLKYNFLYQKFAKEPYDKSKSSDELNLFIPELYEEGPKYYEDLQYRLGLPPQLAPKSFTSEEHLNRSCLEHLVSQLKDMEMDKKNAILCIDIVKIKPHFHYDYELDVINGVDKQLIASYRYAIIAMARGIIADWYQIVSVHFFHDITSTTCDEYRSWANAVMVSLFKNNISIITVVTSTDDFFVKAYSIKKISIENLSSTKYYFYVNGKKVWHIFDPLHLKSCLYKELQENLFIFNDNFTADWMDVKEFYMRDKEREIGLSDISCVIPPEGSQQDKLAAEILLRENTAAGILSFVDMNILREEARHTGVFLKILSESFSFVYPYSYNQTVTDNKTKKLISKTELTKHKKYIKKMLQFFENLKCPKNGVTENGKFIKCSQLSFRSIFAILEETSLLKTIRLSNVSEIMQNFNLDPLVEFIDKIKVKNTKPLTSELLKETIQESLKQSKDPTFINFLINDDDRVDNIKHIKKSNMSMIAKDYLEYISNYSLTDGSNLLSSVSTYLQQKMYRKYSNFVSTRIKLLNSSVSFQHPATGSTGSVTPNDEFYDLVINMDTLFVDYWRQAVSSGKWFATMQAVMSKGITNVRYAAELPSIDFIRDLFIHIRIYQVVTYNNSLYEKERAGSELHKFTVNRLEGYKLEKKKVKLPCLDYHRNPECTKI